ncbi:MAG: RidA family protein [Saprospiraceae bacterium]|jgi:enamine deaminase RidA (YjgF/YER057c/UK114 family)|nr:RidA family protein [Saprospiraceae bacterium]
MEHFLDGIEWENIVGYSRAIKINNTIEVSGTTAYVNNQVIGILDPYLQTKITIEKIIKAVEGLGGSCSDIVRTRIYVKHIRDWEIIGRAHAIFFSTIQPATSMIEVSNLIHPDMLVEIEATAILTK